MPLLFLILKVNMGSKAVDVSILHIHFVYILYFLIKQVTKDSKTLFKNTHK